MSFFSYIELGECMKKICLIGGGHGTSRLIKGFKNKDVVIDVIVASSDNGGHTGEILKEFNVPALGDLRMVLESVIDAPLLDFFKFRFDFLHGKNKVSLGNLMLLSMVLENHGVSKMLDKVNSLVESKYHFHLANNKYTKLMAINDKQEIIEGECNIGECENIVDLYLENDGDVSDSVIDSIMNSDIVVLSFGSFYTSLGSIVCNERIKEALKSSKANLVYIPNLVNQKETSGYRLNDYVDFIENKIDRKINRVIVSNSKIKRKIIRKYSLENKTIVLNKEKRDNYFYYDLLDKENIKLRHNVDYLAEIIINE